jgi:two-component system, NarL family, nitrate/nitrite response regulator NarL
MEQQKIQIIIADDHILFIDGLKSLLKDEKDIVVTDIANDGKELLDILNLHQTDVVLLDIKMPKLNGLETIRYIRQLNRNIKIIVLSSYNDEHLINKAKEYGANGYLLKDCSKDDLLQTIRLVNNGHSCFPYLEPAIPDELDEKDNFIQQLKLTERELEILHLIGKNYSNQQIADQLGLTKFTIDTHRKNINQKLGINKPAALMKFIVENCL